MTIEAITAELVAVERIHDTHQAICVIDLARAGRALALDPGVRSATSEVGLPAALEVADAPVSALSDSGDGVEQRAGPGVHEHLRMGRQPIRRDRGTCVDGPHQSWTGKRCPAQDAFIEDRQALARGRSRSSG